MFCRAELQGEQNTAARDNTFVGRSAGRLNTIETTIFGRSAGTENTGGSDNTFVGRSAAGTNTNGRDITFRAEEPDLSTPLPMTILL